MYLIYGFLSGLIGTAFSVLIRLELSAPGVQYIADNQLYNSIITAHAIVMIFFMVKNVNIILNVKAWLSKVEIFYFFFAICWNTFRAILTSQYIFLYSGMTVT